MAIMDDYEIGLQSLVWYHMTHFKKERKEEARQRAGRLERIRLKDKVDMVLAKGETP
jgi:hypothetical protein